MLVLCARIPGRRMAAIKANEVGRDQLAAKVEGVVPVQASRLAYLSVFSGAAPVRQGTLEFNAGSGPLVLRGLRVWVDEAEPGVDLTLGLHVMKKLG
ncbi:hypothetical protein DYB32_010117 [Aphanomyces invadans]|uniref:Uncharacterized protein n=1 Tax=Aphanomyces invadans TaxID=157072 RepID=A0A3R7CT90_9STRA|nr:hypothetical protein DYB32_010117 [Aphanomyces invadans]